MVIFSFLPFLSQAWLSHLKDTNWFIFLILFQETVWMTVYASVHRLCGKCHMQDHEDQYTGLAILCNYNSLGLSGIPETCNLYTNQRNIWHWSIISSAYREEEAASPRRGWMYASTRGLGSATQFVSFQGSWRWNTPSGFFRIHYDMSSLNLGLAHYVLILLLGPERGHVLSHRPAGPGDVGGEW